MFTRRAKAIRIIGDPDNQRLYEWSSTVLEMSFIWSPELYYTVLFY
jgi:hypothetical protein